MCYSFKHLAMPLSSHLRNTADLAFANMQDLPANNIAWIETLLAKSFIEGGHKDVEGFKALGKCFDQEHRGPLPHSNYMRMFCNRIPSRRAEKEDHSLSLGKLLEQDAERNTQPTQSTTDSATWVSSDNSVGKPEQPKKKSKSEQFVDRHGQKPKRNKGPPGNPPGSKEARLNSRESSFAPSFASNEASRQMVNNGKMVIFVCVAVSTFSIAFSQELT